MLREVDFGEGKEGGMGKLLRGKLAARLMHSAVLAVAIAVAPGAGGHARAETVAEPDGYRTNDYRSPVPATLKGANVVADAASAKKLSADKTVVFVDVYPRPPKPSNLPAGTVWRDPPHESIPGAHWLANVGYGVIPPAMQDYFTSHLDKLTGSDKSRPVVFFCLRHCWMSWNAAKRALEMGYTNVSWFPDGVDAWRDAELPIANLEPMP